MSASVEFSSICKGYLDSIKSQMKRRAIMGSNELRKAALITLRGKGSGRVYRVPGTKRNYTASAPGEVPAVRTGTYRGAWEAKSKIGFNHVVSKIENQTTAGNYVLGELLEEGSPGGQLAPRPHIEKIKEKALPVVMRIYSKPYF